MTTEKNEVVDIARYPDFKSATLITILLTLFYFIEDIYVIVANGVYTMTLQFACNWPLILFAIVAIWRFLWRHEDGLFIMKSYGWMALGCQAYHLFLQYLTWPIPSSFIYLAIVKLVIAMWLLSVVLRSTQVKELYPSSFTKVTAIDVIVVVIVAAGIICMPWLIIKLLMF